MNIRIVPPPLSHVENNPDLYLFNSPGLVLAERLVFGLMLDAMRSGVCDLQWQSRAACHLVISSANWLTTRAAAAPEVELFERIVPLLNVGQNSIRHEISVFAFALHVVLIGPKVEIIKGSGDVFPIDWLKNERSGYGVAFCL